MIPSILERAALLDADSPALDDVDGVTSYGETLRRIRRLAAVLSDHLDPGSRVGLLAPNGRFFFEVTFAAAHAGLVLVPLNLRLTPTTQRRLLDHAGATGLLVADACRDAARALEASAPPAGNPDHRRVTWTEGPTLDAARDAATPRPRAPGQPDDPAHVYYTSGTTGDPKGVILTHRNVCSHALMATTALGLTDDDTWGHIAPMFHLADAWATCAITWVGGRHVFLPKFDPATILDALATKVTVTNLVPTMLSDLVHHPGATRDYPTLRRILSGGAPISPTLVGRIAETFGADYVQTYGLTETSPFLTMSTLPRRLRSVDRDEQLRLKARTGRPLAGVELRVVDSSGKEVPRDGTEVGEITVRGDSVTPGYWENPAATQEALRDGWFYTGDLAVCHDAGFLEIVDRRKDIILTGGETVYSTEVERALAAHPDIREVAAFGIPHPRWGEAVVVAVVLKSAVEEHELASFARTALGGHQRPKRYMVCESLPRTGSGKVTKQPLRERFAALFVDESASG